MQNKNRVNKIIVEKIIEYCEKIEELPKMFGETFEDFNSNFAFQMAFSMCVIQIGELITQLSEDFKAQHSEIAWIKIKGLRNIIVHDYYHVKFEILWKILMQDVPILKKNLQSLLES